MPFSVTISGLANTQLLLKRMAYSGSIQAITTAVAQELKAEIAPYPPLSEANDPSRARWYERGFGTRYRLADGGIGGKRTSQNLKTRWGVKNTGQGRMLVNTATYAPYVHSAQYQAGFHKKRGWRTFEDAMEKLTANGTIRRSAIAALRLRFRAR